MTARAYRDDGPLARAIGRKVGDRVPVDELVLTLVAALPLVAALATASAGYTVAAAAACVLVAGAGSERGRGHALTWLVPPLLRALEYGFVLALTLRVDADAVPLCFAFLTVVALHHYDTVYRLSHARAGPPSWVEAAGGGWDGRILLSSVLALAGVLDLGLLAGAVGLALVWAGETAASWARYGPERLSAGEDAGEGEDALVE